MADIESTRSELLDAQNRVLLVDFYRPSLDPIFSTLGYVLDAGSEWILVERVSDHVFYDGYEVCRIPDIDQLSVPHDHAAFFEKALSLLGHQRPPKPAIDLADARTIIQSIPANFPLITIHRELVDSDICHIGQVMEIDANELIMREITPDAEWEAELDRYALPEITRIGFGASYEKALYLVASQKDH